MSGDVKAIVSPHTVYTHLRHVFAKLGVSSRAELARIAAERDAKTCFQMMRSCDVAKRRHWCVAYGAPDERPDG